uniref:RING-type E3 ubiquitin transferase n=1 Tax=Chaetoceros debilis TaxID=122233 RepID=A0A7S3Q5R0_9STRA
MNTVLSTPLNSHSPREEDSFTLTSSKSKTSSSDSNSAAMSTSTSTSTPLCENTPRFSPIRIRATDIARERQQRPMKNQNRTYRHHHHHHVHERTHDEFHVHVDVDVDVDESFDMNNSQSARSSDANANANANTTVAGTGSTNANVDASFRRILLDSSSIAFDCDESRNETNHACTRSEYEHEGEYEISQGGAGIEASTATNVNVNSNVPSDVHNNNDDNASDDGPGPGPGPRNEETAEDKRLREEAESEELCRALMAEEAMASYNQSTHFLQDHADQYSEEDLAALRAIMAEESPIVEEHGDGDEFEEGDYESDEELSYDALLDLGERIGDVKQERWAVRAADEIAKLTCKTFCKAMGEGKDENDADVKCLVCQFAYEEGEKVTILPCRHYFHSECVGQWLGAKDFCPYCRQCIVIANDTDAAVAEE